MSTRRVWDLDADHIQVSEGRVFYTFSSGAATHANMKSMIRNVHDFVHASDLPVGYVLHLSSNARPPISQDRDRATAMFNACGTRLAGVALVVDASGFTGALLRGASNAVFIMQRRAFTPRVFESIQDAADWLAPKVNMLPAQVVMLARRTREHLSTGKAIE